MGSFFYVYSKARYVSTILVWSMGPQPEKRRRFEISRHLQANEEGVANDVWNSKGSFSRPSLLFAV